MKFQSSSSSHYTTSNLFAFESSDGFVEMFVVELEGVDETLQPMRLALDRRLEGLGRMLIALDDLESGERRNVREIQIQIQIQTSTWLSQWLVVVLSSCLIVSNTLVSGRKNVLTIKFFSDHGSISHMLSWSRSIRIYFSCLFLHE